MNKLIFCDTCFLIKCHDSIDLFPQNDNPYVILKPVHKEILRISQEEGHSAHAFACTLLQRITSHSDRFRQEDSHDDLSSIFVLKNEMTQLLNSVDLHILKQATHQSENIATMRTVEEVVILTCDDALLKTSYSHGIRAFAGLHDFIRYCSRDFKGPLRSLDKKTLAEQMVLAEFAAKVACNNKKTA